MLTRLSEPLFTNAFHAACNNAAPMTARKTVVLTDGKPVDQFGQIATLEQIPIDMNRGGFPWARESDSPYWLGMEASMDGSATFDGSA